MVDSTAAGLIFDRPIGSLLIFRDSSRFLPPSCLDNDASAAVRRVSSAVVKKAAWGNRSNGLRPLSFKALFGRTRGSFEGSGMYGSSSSSVVSPVLLKFPGSYSSSSVSSS
eukprot:CAMPEP_0185751290 /NCGR_PEP_ID=MMETSP1174-20130828/10048_1 /TAXON_ID=35687 /ORGANISM="Dictyocha speculum, Strain CCMP1381" /LENGTH=110 /DNA_ID=CAMNT_0028428187 /DNA_START=511 /DNA_END=840 /DNA_ORIENTATION=+